MPANWQWTDAFVHRLNTDVPIVSSSLVCLPAVDAGGYGPKVLGFPASQLSTMLWILPEQALLHPSKSAGQQNL